MKKKKCILILFIILTIINVFTTTTLVVNAESATSARDRAAAKNGWKWVNGNLHVSHYHCNLDGIYQLYFYEWFQQPTCISGGRTVLYCGFAGIYSGTFNFTIKLTKSN